MPLDLQPVTEAGVLDLQPVENAPPVLDLQPVEEVRDPHNAVLSQGAPEGFWARARRVGREKLANLIGPSPEMIMRDGIPMPDGSIAYKPYGSDVDRMGFFPALSQPMVPIPRIPQQEGKVAQVAAGTVNTLAGFAEFVESPLGLMTAGVGGLGSATLNRIMAGGYSADIARHVPDAAEVAGAMSVTGTLQQQVEADLGLGVAVALPAALGRSALKRGPKPEARSSETFSEFGDDAPAKLDVVPVPEAAETLAAQVAATRAPNTPKSVTLVTPGAEVPAGHGLTEIQTIHGKVLVNAEKISPAEAVKQIEAGEGGKLMGFSTDAKPAGDAVLQTKTRDGVVIQDEVVTRDTLPAAVEAAKAVTPDAVLELKPAQEVIAERLSAIERSVLRDDVTARKPLPALLVERAQAEGEYPLPEGYRREGERFVYEEPAKAETESARMAREQREAMDRLREQTGLDLQPVENPKPETRNQPRERIEEGTPLPTWDRPPDILDWIEDNFGGVRVPAEADFAWVGEQLKDLSQSKAAELSGSKLKRLFRGEAHDTVLEALNREGVFGGAETPEALFTKMINAAKGRVAWLEQEKAARSYKPTLEETRTVTERVSEDIDPWQETIDKILAEEGEVPLQFSIDKGESGGKVPRHEPRFTDTQIDAAVERLKAGLREDFGPEPIRGIRRVEPDLRHDATADQIGISQEGRQAFESAFGVKLVWLLADNKLPFGGVRDRALPRLLFLDARNQRPALFIAAHELMHELKNAHPDIYQRLDIRLQGMLKDFPEYKARMDELYKKEGEVKDAAAREELYANFIGDQFTRLDFWRKAQQWEPTLFARLASAVRAILDKAKLALTGFESSRWFTDVQRAQDVLVEAVAEFAHRRNRQPGEQTGRQYSAEERATGLKVKAISAISPEVKAAITEYLYEPRANRTDVQLAEGIIERVGLDEAWKLWQAAPVELPGAVRSKLLGAITKRLAEQERQVQATDPAAAQALAERQAAIWNEALPQITDIAQSLQAMRDMVQMSPEAQVARVRRELDQAATAELDRHRGEIDQVREAIDAGRAAGVDAVRKDADVNASAREAVDEAVRNSDDVHRAVVMELAEPWAQVPAIVNHARAAVHAKANELLNKAPRPPGLTPAQHLRQIVDDLAKRSAEIFASHIQGAEPGVPIVQKLQNRLGLDREHAGKLATALSKEWDRQLEGAKKKLDARIAMQRAKQIKREAEAQTDTLVDKAIRRQLRELNTKLGDVLRQEAGRQGETSEHVADRVVKASGLAGEKAESLRATLKRRWDELVSDGQRKALEAIQKGSGVTVTRKVKDAFEKLVELDRLGGLRSEKFYDVVNSSLKLKQLTEADAKQLRELVKAAQEAPAGWQQQRAQAKVLSHVQHLRGELAWWDVPMAVWYANIFSAPPTHLANIIGNTFKAMEVLGIETLKRPMAAPQILRAFVRGAETGVLEAANVLRTGQVEGTRLMKAEPARPLEWRIQQGGWNKVFLPWATIGRLLAAEDVVPFKAHEEIRWTLAARRVAKSEGLRGEMLDRRVNELLHNTAGEWQTAKAQAAKEGLQGLDLYRRAHEIVEQRREASMPGSTELARNYGLQHTFNSEPYGLMGAIAEVLNFANQKLVVTRFAMPVVRIIANLSNESLNYFPPVAAVRLAIAAKTRRLEGKEIASSEELNYAIARAAVGTVLFGALAIAATENIEDPDPVFMISGQGPRTRAQREQLRATGWKPNSVKVGGRYYSYQETQLAIPLNALGNYFDAIRYKNLSDEDAATRLAYVMQNSAQTILDQRMLSGLADMMDALSSESTSGSGKELTRFLSRPAASFVVPNAARWVDQVFDPAVYDADDVKGLIYQQIPVARRQNRAALNVFGEPIERRPMDRFTTAAKPDDLVTILASKNAWVPMPGIDGMVVGDRQRGPDYFRPITPEEYYQLIAETGPQIRAALTKELDKLAVMEPEEAQAHVRRISSEIRREALQKYRP